MELAEVKAAFPQIECVLFSAKDYAGIESMLYSLRNSFAKKTITQEDALRPESLRASEAFRDQTGKSAPSYESFMREAAAVVTLDFVSGGSNSRSLELVNKTNQFNLNGKRLTEAAWQDTLSNPSSFLLTVNYEDKYGPLGRIAVLLGRIEEKSVSVDSWVMSCRAFSRRIEHQCLKQLCERFAAAEIILDYQATPRNGPLQEFLAAVAGGPLTAPLRISRNDFLGKCPALHHRVKELVNA